MPTLAALLACHNRREKTMACLSALSANRLPGGVSLHVVLVDDGSSDGTADAVLKRFPEVDVIRGDGSLYWNGGMRVAFGHAMQTGHDDYLWLNDDTLLDPDAVERMYQCREQMDGLAEARRAPSIIVGATRDGQTGRLTYGGLYNAGHALSHHYVKLAPANRPQPCTTFNGNCVLISSAAARVLGNLDPSFVHGLGDWDYGLRARAAGIGMWMAPNFVGSCSHNEPHPFAPEASRSVRARLRHICGPKQFPPRAWRAYVRRHFPFLWPVYFVRPYLGATARALLSRLHPSDGEERP